MVELSNDPNELRAVAERMRQAALTKRDPVKAAFEQEARFLELRAAQLEGQSDIAGHQDTKAIRIKHAPLKADEHTADVTSSTEAGDGAAQPN